MVFPNRPAEFPPSCPFDPDHPSTISDPYPGYQWLRDQAPVHYLAEHDLWVVARYNDVLDVLNNPHRFSSQLGMGAVNRLHAPRSVDYRIGAPGVRVLIATDPPEHTRLRRAVLAPFRRPAITKLIPGIERIARELVAGLLENAEHGQADAYSDLAAPLPVLVIAELLGVPPQMRGEFREWASVITDDLDRANSTDTRLGRGYDMFRYFYSEIRRRRREPGDDLFSVLAATDAVGLSDHEVMAFCAFLLVAGVETTTNLFTNLIDTPSPWWRSHCASTPRYRDCGALPWPRIGWEGSPCPQVRDCWSSSVRPTGTGGCSPTPIPSISSARRTRTSRSVTATIAAWARYWPGWSWSRRLRHW
jgi:cytochrome P450